MKQLFKNNSGFTFVELLVSIVILAILTTLGSVEYNKYLSDVRDTNRIYQLKAIGGGIESYQIYNTLPLPDASIDIYGSGTLLGYQGYAGNNLLQAISYSNSWVDPKDEINFSYYVNHQKNKFQLLSFLEIPANKELSFTPGVYANVDYSRRYPKVYGDSLGIFTDANYTPIQEVESVIIAEELDVVLTDDVYISHLTDSINLVWTGQTLKASIIGGWLVGYWSFDTMSGSTIIDESPYETIGTVSWWASLSTGHIWNSLSFDGIDDHFVVDNIPNISLNNTPAHSVTGWLRPSDTSCSSSSCQQWALFLWSRNEGTSSWVGTHHWYIWGSRWNGFGPDDKKYTPTLVEDAWNHIVITFDGNTTQCFLNGQQSCSKQKSASSNPINMKSADLVLGEDLSEWNAFYQWYIDELRIYDRVLSASEVQTLYNVEK